MICAQFMMANNEKFEDKGMSTIKMLDGATWQLTDIVHDPRLILSGEGT